MALERSPRNMYGDGLVIAVVDDIAYYVTMGEYSENGNTFLFGVNVNGGASEFLASWFTP